MCSRLRSSRSLLPRLGDDGYGCPRRRLVASVPASKWGIRYCGKKFDPVKEYDEENSDDLISDAMGVGIVKKMSSRLEYSEILGINNLLIHL